MLLDIDQEERQLFISYYDENGETKIVSYALDTISNWHVCSDDDRRRSLEYMNWDGRPVKKGFAKKLNKYSIIEFLESLPKEETDAIFADYCPKTYFVDIEVEVIDGFPAPEIAENRVTTICIVTPDNFAIVLATKELDYEKQKGIQSNINEHFKDLGNTYNFVYKTFKSEYDMLSTFFVSYMKKFPMVSGWNFVAYDWKYLINRARKINIDPRISSPVGKLTGRNDFPVHVGVIDYMELYRKWDKTIDVKENFTLDAAGDAVLGIRKVKYQGSLQDMYEKDYDRYVFYNVIDTALVQLIHNKIRTLEIMLTLTNICKMSLYKASSPVAITEGLICREMLKQNKVMGTDWNASTGGKSTQYVGAYVKSPILGMHQAVACFDFASLYPSIMRQMNISPDSFIKKIDPDWNNLRPPLFEQMDKTSSMKMSVEERKRALDDIPGNKIVSVTGAIYDADDSILKQILGRLYKERQLYKKKNFEYQLIADKIKKHLRFKTI